MANTSAEHRLREVMAGDAPLQQKLNEVLAVGKNHLPAELLQQLMSPIEALIASNAADLALKEGAQVPDFTLPNVFGKSVTLSHLLKQGPVVIAFYRGSWCPYCNMQLHAYQQVLPQIQELGASLVAISPQSPDQSLSLAEKKERGWPECLFPLIWGGRTEQYADLTLAITFTCLLATIYG